MYRTCLVRNPKMAITAVGLSLQPTSCSSETQLEPRAAFPAEGKTLWIGLETHTKLRLLGTKMCAVMGEENESEVCVRGECWRR